MDPFPSELAYTAEHEWVRRPGAEDASGALRVGITNFAQEQLGDIVYISFPQVGDDVEAGQTCGELESTKSVSDLYAPVTGRVVARNDVLEQQPELVNADPYGDGWIMDIEPADPQGLSGADLLDAQAYAEQVGEA